MGKIKDIVVIGAGGHAREVADVIDAINAQNANFNLLGYIIDLEYGTVGSLVNGKPILGDFTWFEQNPKVNVICGVGYPDHRRKLVERAISQGVSFCSLVHPTAVLTRWIDIGLGTVIMAGCVLSNQIKIGNHVCINRLATIGHNCFIEDYVTVSPGVCCSGNVYVQEGCFVGTGANIIEKCTIGRWATVGAGSTIIRNVADNSTVVGVPGRTIRIGQQE